MLKQILILLAVLVLIPIVLKIIYKLHLLPLAVYYVLIKTVFVEWSEAHPYISIGLFAFFIMWALFFWLRPIFCRIQEDRETKQLLLNGIRIMHEQGFSDDQYSINVIDGIPVFEYEQ